jgi:hypothetical protein
VDGGRLHNQTESLIEVNSGALRETPDDPTSLVSIERFIGEELVRENPLLLVTTLEPRGWGTSSHVPLLIRALYSCFIVVCQFRSARGTSSHAPLLIRTSYSSSIAVRQFGSARGNKFSCPIAHQGPVLLLYSRAPIQIGKGSVDRGQNDRRRHRGSHDDESESVMR